MRNVYVLIQLLGIIFIIGGFFYGQIIIGIVVGLICFIWGGVGYRKVQKEKKLEKHLIPCPFCKELIQKDAIKCKHCGSDLEPAS